MGNMRDFPSDIESCIAAKVDTHFQRAYFEALVENSQIPAAQINELRDKHIQASQLLDQVIDFTCKKYGINIEDVLAETLKRIEAQNIHYRDNPGLPDPPGL